MMWLLRRGGRFVAEVWTVWWKRTSPSPWSGRRRRHAVSGARRLRCVGAGWFGDHADVRCAFAEDDGPELGSPLGFGGFFEQFQGDAVPAVGFLEGEFAVEFEVERVVLAELDVLVFDGDFA